MTKDFLLGKCQCIEKFKLMAVFFKDPKIVDISRGVNTETSYGLSVQSNNQYYKKNDKETWQAFQNGDEGAFIFIYKSHFEGLFKYGSQFTKDKELIKDCIQDLFIELNENRLKLASVSFIKFYLFKSLKNKIWKHLKINQKISLCNDFERGFDFHFEFSEEQNIINLQLDKENSIKLNNAIKTLTPRQKEIIYYYYHEGLSFYQIQELMDLNNIKSIKNLLYKAIVMLRQQISLSLFIALISKI